MLAEVSASTRQWERGRLSVEFQSDTIMLLLLLIKTHIRFPGEITKSLSTIEISKDPGRWLTILVSLLGLGVDWLRGEGSQQVIIASSGRPAGALRGRLFFMTWQPATPGEKKTPGDKDQGDDQGDLTGKITQRCWTRQKLSWKISSRLFLRNFLIWH